MPTASSPPWSQPGSSESRRTTPTTLTCSVSEYANMAARLGLLVTGGTDFHGAHAPNPTLGSVDVPHEAVRRLARGGEAALAALVPA